MMRNGCFRRLSKILTAHWKFVKNTKKSQSLGESLPVVSFNLIISEGLFYLLILYVNGGGGGGGWGSRLGAIKGGQLIKVGT